MRQTQLAISLRVLPKFVRRAVRLQSDENSHLVDVFEGGINLVKSADIKVADKAIEMACVLCQKRTESITQAITGLVCNERQVRGITSGFGLHEARKIAEI